MNKYQIMLGAACAVALMVGMGQAEQPAKPVPVKTLKIDAGAGYDVPPPLGLDPVRIPKDNPMTPEKIALGKQLFFDPRLSVDGTISCASCHNPTLGWSNGLSFAFGVRGQTGRRSAPTVLNSAYNDAQFWDGRAPSLEEQAKGPMVNPIEMGNTHARVVATLKAIPGYADQFVKVFGTRDFNINQVVQAIAAYERTIVSGNSPFDRYRYGEDRKAMTAGQIRGMELFKDKQGPNCAQCHRFDDFSAPFTDFQFHNIGVGIDHPAPDKGREAVTGLAEDRGKFRTPTLRGITLTAPYMHDGRFATLDQVLDFYMKGGTPNPNLDREMHRFDLTPADRAALLSFLNALTGDPMIETPPDLPPSPQPAKP